MEKVTEKLEGMDVWIYHGQINIPNNYSAGAVGSRFLIGLRDKKKIIAFTSRPGLSVRIALANSMSGLR
jgi:hypothetical protein